MDRIVAREYEGCSFDRIVATCTCSLSWFGRVAVVGKFGFGIVPYEVDSSIIVTIAFGIDSIAIC